MLLFYYKRCVINVDNKNPLLDEEKNGLFIDNEELVLPDEIKKEETEEKTLKEEVPIVDDDVIEKTYSYNDTPEPREVSDEPTEEVKSIYLEDLEKINREKEEPVEEEVTIEIPEREEKSEEDKILDEKPVIENTESTPFISLEPDNKEEPSKEPAKKEESHDKDNKSDKKAQITTAIFTVIVLLLLFITLRNFYYGFKYKDYDLNNQTTENEKNKTIGLALKDISLDSIVMNNTAKKINADYCLGTSNLVEVLYTDKKVNMNSLSITEVETILFNYLNKNECTETPKELKKEEIEQALITLFGPDKSLKDLENKTELTIGNLKVTYNKDQNSYILESLNCGLCNTDKYLIKKIKSAQAENDFLYIYEYFGYVKQDPDKNNTYHIYDDGLSKNKRTTFIKLENEEFKEFSSLKVYKWTFLKNESNDYHFISVEPMLE